MSMWQRWSFLFIVLYPSSSAASSSKWWWQLFSISSPVHFLPRITSLSSQKVYTHYPLPSGRTTFHLSCFRRFFLVFISSHFIVVPSSKRVVSIIYIPINDSTVNLFVFASFAPFSFQVNQRKNGKLILLNGLFSFKFRIPYQLFMEGVLMTRSSRKQF